MITVDGVRQLREKAAKEINSILILLEQDTGLKVIDAKHRYFAEREKGDKFEIEIRFESI